MKNLYCLIMIVLFVGCKELGAGDNLVGMITILFVDEQGNNLLTSSTSPISMDDIVLYYYDKDLNYVPLTSTYPNNLGGINHLGLLKVYPVMPIMDGTYIPGGRGTTYLDFNNGDIDTIQTTMVEKPSGKYLNQAWYNGKQVIWENVPTEYTDNGFTVVKSF